MLSSEKGGLANGMDVTGQGGLWLEASRENKKQCPSEDKGKEEPLF